MWLKPLTPFGHRSPSQANHPKLPVSLGESHIIMSSLSNVPNVLALSHIFTSQDAVWCGSEWICLLWSLQSVCKRHAYTLPRRRASAVRGRYGFAATPAHHSFSSVIWGLISTDLSTGYGIGGLLSASPRALLCPLLRLRDASNSPTHSSFS
jgi:hypothetical protein